MNRLYRNEDDLQAMRRILVEGRRAGGPTYYVHTGDLDWWLFYPRKDFEGRTYIWEDAAGAVVGWALLSPTYRAIDVFADEARTTYAERCAMFTWAEERMAEIVRQSGGRDVNTIWISEHDAATIAHLEARGFAPSEEAMVRMECPLDDPVAAPDLLPGYSAHHVRNEAEGAMRAAASHAAFESSLPIEAYTQNYINFTRAPVYAPERDVIVEAPDGRCAAFCIIWLDPVNAVGHFEPVGTHPDFQRKGLGKAVLIEGLRRMRAQGMQRASVCVEENNPPAQKLYTSVGFRPVHRLLTYTKPCE